MPEKKQKPLDNIDPVQMALSCWENEGGAKAQEKGRPFKIGDHATLHEGRRHGENR